MGLGTKLSLTVAGLSGSLNDELTALGIEHDHICFQNWNDFRK